ncbi:NADPH-dependent F420 reductase [Agrococcus beijingensis]|uniref:NADPH-dependent F420 reductase n=1 Tax=Agrococcus beijingensis TaxID=3068634 RepID=UPI00274201B3|nr:NADPH-dependent F420 reductase [Agrococcus sp. REN33]
MTTISIFGNGNMGTAIAGLLGAGGAEIQQVGEGETEELSGDIVVLAVPYAALASIAEQYGEQLAGRTVVDITNPLDFETFDRLVVPVGSSAAAELAAKLPSSKVLKAFNTTFAATLGSKRVGDLTTTVLVAGDDADAKATLIAAVQAGGADAIDAGSLARAHELEAMGFLQLTLAASEKIAWTGGFGIVR